MGMHNFLTQVRNKLPTSKSVSLSIAELIDSVRRQIRGDDGVCPEESEESSNRTEHISGSSSGGGSAVGASLPQWEGSWKEVQLLGLLGEGAFGKVYQGLWKGEPVAVKTMVLPNNVSGIEKRERMAIMEAAISTALSHPNIVQVGMLSNDRTAPTSKHH